MREEPDAATLIAYERPDLAGNKESRYRLVAVPEADELRAALESVLGIAVVVAKTRRLFIHEGVRIHLDRVEGLGDFIEVRGRRRPRAPTRLASPRCSTPCASPSPSATRTSCARAARTFSSDR